MSERPSLPDVTDPQWGPFWRHARDGELWAPGCGSCGAVWWPPGSPRCPECLGTDVQWRPLDGRGQVWSVAIYHRAFQPAFAADVPYTVALVELANGVAMVGRVIGARPLAPGDEAVAVFERVTDEVTLIRFAAADPEQETDDGR